MIRNRGQFESSADYTVALDCIEAAIEAAAPEAATRSSFSLDGESLIIGGENYDLSKYTDIFLVGAGKAAEGVARTIESVLGDRITHGLIITKQSLRETTVPSIIGDHPLPSKQNVTAASDILDIVDNADEETLVLCILTGGASSLLTSPAGDLTLDDVKKITTLLLEGGVPINEINTVRKHLSACKGGQLARRAAPGTVVGLLLSDVVGNDLSTIGSGPTVPDETTYEDALEVLERHDLNPPDAVRNHLTAGVNGDRAKTPFMGNPVFDQVDNHLIGDNMAALDAARDVAEGREYTPLILTSRLRGEASEAAKALVSIAEEVVATGTPVEPPAILLAGGETTVSISGKGGNGGPNQELVLSAALERAADVVVAAVDTDGEDGSSDAAGAIVDDIPLEDEEYARACLAANDAGTYLTEVGETIETGPTGTNVNDVVVVVVGRPDV